MEKAGLFVASGNVIHGMGTAHRFQVQSTNYGLWKRIERIFLVDIAIFGFHVKLRRCKIQHDTGRLLNPSWDVGSVVSNGGYPCLKVMIRHMAFCDSHFKDKPMKKSLSVYPHL